MESMITRLLSFLNTVLQDNIIQVTGSSTCMQYPVIYVLNPTSLAKNNAISQLQTIFDAYNVDIRFFCES